MAEPLRCDFISYFGQGYDRIDSGATTASILRTYPYYNRVGKIRYRFVSYVAPLHKTPFARYNLLFNQFDNRMTTAVVSCIQTFNRLPNRFDNRLNVCIHDTTAVVNRLSNRFDNKLDNRLYRVNGGWQPV